ncbi:MULTISPECIES: hypothetical protein [unclassified Microcoleus]|nr:MULTISPECIES: hypothetical protein [unclassified Microcoleus]
MLALNLPKSRLNILSSPRQHGRLTPAIDISPDVRSPSAVKIV